MGSAAVIGAGALLGGIAGGAGSRTTQTTRRRLGPAGALETQAGQLTQDQLTQLQQLIGSGAGQQDVTAALAAQRGLAGQIETAQATGGQPTAADITTAQGLAGQFLQPQQIALQQSLEQSRTQAARLAGIRGITQDDPILQAKLAQQAGRGAERLGAQQSALGTQIAQGLPQQRIGLAQQLAGVRGGLASQALQNRQTLLNLGQSALGQQQQFRLGGAATTSTQTGGGGLGGFLTGAIGGAGAGARLFNQFGGGGGGQQAASQGAIGGFFQAPNSSQSAIDLGAGGSFRGPTLFGGN